MRFVLKRIDRYLYGVPIRAERAGEHVTRSGIGEPCELAPRAVASSVFVPGVRACGVLPGPGIEVMRDRVRLPGGAAVFAETVQDIASANNERAR